MGKSPALRAHLMGRPLQVVGALAAEVAAAAEVPAQDARARDEEPEEGCIQESVCNESQPNRLNWQSDTAPNTDLGGQITDQNAVF